MQRTRRQFSTEIIKCDGFINMPATAQALYFHIIGTCDDEGFTSQLTSCKYMAHATDEDVDLLIENRFILKIPNEHNCVVVVKHWLQSNYIKKGVTKTDFSERDKVFVKPNGNYSLDESEGIRLSEFASSGRTRMNKRADTSSGYVRPSAAADTSVPTQLNSTQLSNTPSNDSVLPTTQLNSTQSNSIDGLEDLPEELDIDLG